jgi:WD40 repeat protein
MLYPTDTSFATTGVAAATNQTFSLIKALSSLLLACTLNGCDRSLEPFAQIPVANGSIAAGALDDRGEFAVVGSLHHGISYWRLEDHERLYDWKHTDSGGTVLAAADFSPGSDWALTADNNTLVLWNTATGEAPRYWQAPGEILSVQLSRDGSQALLGLGDHTGVIFDIRRGGVLHTLHHANPVTSVALDTAADIAVTGSEDRTAATWDLRTGKKLATMHHNEGVQLVAISADGTLVLSVSKYDKAVIWQSQSGNVVTEIPLRAGRLKRGLRFTSARFSTDNQLLLTGQTDQTIVLWQMKDLKNPMSWKIGTRRLWKPSGASIIDVAFTSDPTVLRAMASNGLLYDLKVPEAK